MSTILHTVKLVASANEAIQGIRKFEDAIIGVERTVDAHARTLSGERLIQGAHNWTAAVAKLGGATNGLATQAQILAGVSKMTESEQAKINRTVTETIAKFRALGQTAPSAMLELEKATHRATQTTSSLATVIGKVGPSLVGMMSVGALSGAVRSVVQWADDLDEVSTGIGMTAENLQRLQFAWSQTGSSMEAGDKASQTTSEMP